MRKSVEAKLNELRVKTDRQLASLISNRLDRGLAFARVLESEESGEDWASTEHFRVNAERALSDARAWMSLLAGATQMQRHRLEFKLTQLGDILERTAILPMRARAAC